MNNKQALEELKWQVGNIHFFQRNEYGLPIQTPLLLTESGLFETIEKELKAFEIIKSKEINIHALILHLNRFDSPSGYNALVGEKYKLTEQEYDLLKEVLL